MMRGLYKIVELILKLISICTTVYYNHKSAKREKQIETIKDDKLSEEERLRALRDLSK